MSEKKDKLILLEKGIVIFSLGTYFEELKKDFEEENILQEEFDLQTKYLNSISKKLELKVKFR